MSKTTIITFLFATIFSTQVFAAQKIKHCGSATENDVEFALDFLKNNLETIMGDVSDLKSKEKKKLRKKIDKVNIKCMDHKRVCKKKATRGGVDRHLFNQAVVICPNNIRTALQEDSFCTLAEVVLHEVAHSAGVKKENGHNTNGERDDRVYRTGFAAYDLCDSAGLNKWMAFNTNN